MAAKKTKTEEKKKRIKPVVEVVEEEPQVLSEEAVTSEVAETPEPASTEEAETAASEMKTEEVSDDPPEKVSSEHKMSIKTVLVIAIISALVAAFVSGGVYVYLNGISELKSTMQMDDDTQETDVEVEETPSPTPEPTEAPQVSDDLTVYTIEVLNGSGEIGAAGRASDVLENGGFVVSDTGNADKYDYTDTVVKHKEDLNQADIDALVVALEEEYEVKLSDELLDEDSEYDFVVTVGSN